VERLVGRRVPAKTTYTPPEPPPSDGLVFAEATLRSGYVTLTGAQVFSALGGLSGTNHIYSLPADGKDYLIDFQWSKWNRSIKIGVRNGQRCHVRNVYIDVDKPTSVGDYTRSTFGFRPVALSDAPGHCSITGALLTGTTMADGLLHGQTSATVQGGPFTYQWVRVESRSGRLGRNVNYPTDESNTGVHIDAQQTQGPGHTFQFGNCTLVMCSTSGSGAHAGKGMMLNSYLTRNEQYFLTNVNFRDDDNWSTPTNTGGAWLKDEKTSLMTLSNVWARKYGGGWTWDNKLIFYSTPSKAAGQTTQIPWTVTGTAPNRVATFPNDDGITGQVNEGTSPDGQDFCTRADLQALGLVV
jgi:hypothetical protein